MDESVIIPVNTPICLQHFFLLLREFALQGQNLLSEQPDPLWLNTVRTRLGRSEFLHLCLQIWINTKSLVKMLEMNIISQRSSEIAGCLLKISFDRMMKQNRVQRPLLTNIDPICSIWARFTRSNAVRPCGSTARAPLCAKNVKQQPDDLIKNNTCMTVSRHVQLTVHKYGLEARLGPGLNWSGWYISWWLIDGQTGGYEGEMRSRARHKQKIRDSYTKTGDTRNTEEALWETLLIEEKMWTYMVTQMCLYACV